MEMRSVNNNFDILRAATESTAEVLEKHLQNVENLEVIHPLSGNTVLILSILNNNPGVTELLLGKVQNQMLLQEMGRHL